MLENILVGIIVLGAVVWAVGEGIKALRTRQRPTPGCGCPSSSRCATLAARRRAAQREARNEAATPPQARR